MLSNQLSIQYDKMTILFTVIITDIDENQVNTKKGWLCQILTVFIKIYIEFCGKSQNFVDVRISQSPCPQTSAFDTPFANFLYGRHLIKVSRREDIVEQFQGLFISQYLKKMGKR